MDRIKYELEGKKFGSLYVVERLREEQRHGVWWLCKCECGNSRAVRTDKLVKGQITCCEKCKPRYKDMTGLRFGRLTVLRYNGSNHRGDATWLCRCDCGKEKVIQGQALRSGAVVSCGCYNKQKLVTHRGTHERLYGIWHGMKDRCNNPNGKSYKYYGAKGVHLCDEWDKDYSAFRKWAYENGYDEDAEFQKCTIDRIDPFGNYEPDNCRWVDIVTQERNRRNSRVKNNNPS